MPQKPAKKAAPAPQAPKPPPPLPVPPIAEGDFVWVLFPTDQHPRQPGLRHICYVYGINPATTTAPATAMVAYSTSQPLPPNTPVPQGVRVFKTDEAAALNQRPFRLHIGRLATLPLTSTWFPDLEEPNQGIVARAPKAFRDELYQLLLELNTRRKNLVTMAGPFQR